MSRVGKKPVILDSKVKVSVKADNIFVEGPLGKLELKKPSCIAVNISGNQVEVRAENKSLSNIQGLFRSLLQNAVSGTVKQWEKTLELVGVGFRAETTGSELTLSLGFSHLVKIKAPPGISFKVAENKITVIGIDKYLVGEVAANIRRLKKPDPYKGKGIRYLGEYIRKKVGKAAKAVGGTGAK